MIFLSKKPEISSINLDKSEKTPKRGILANLVNFYNIKLCKTITISSFIEDINTPHFLGLSIDTKDKIC